MPSIDCKQALLPRILILLVAIQDIFVKDSMFRCRMITTCIMSNSNTKGKQVTRKCASFTNSVLSMAPIIIALNIYICSLLEDEHHNFKLSWGDTLTI